MAIKFLGATTFIIIDEAKPNVMEETKFESNITLNNKTSGDNFKIRQFHYVKSICQGNL